MGVDHPILFDIKKSNLRGPLAFFQSVEFSEDDFRKLLKTINSGRLSEANFKDVFDTWWPKLKRSIEAIKPAPQPALKKPSDGELLQEILGVTRNLVIEHQKLVQVLTPPPIEFSPANIEALLRALRRGVHGGPGRIVEVVAEPVPLSKSDILPKPAKVTTRVTRRSTAL
jgi:hypothetical protein